LKKGIYAENEVNGKKHRIGMKHGEDKPEDEKEQDGDNIVRIKQYLSELNDLELQRLLQVSNQEHVKFHALQELKKRQNERERKYSRIRSEARSVIQGHKRISRLPEEAESGRIEGGTRNVEASCLIGRSKGTISQDTRQLKQSQELRLEEWARHEKIWFDHADIRKNWVRYDNGTSVEAEVYYFVETKTVRKVFHYDAVDYNCTPMDFIDNRISIHNALFSETKYKLVGVTKTKKGFAFVLEQPYIEGEKMTEKEIEEFMDSIGFPNHAGTYHWNDYYAVGDMHAGNILKSKDADDNMNVFVIDPIPRLNTLYNENIKYLPFNVI